MNFSKIGVLGAGTMGQGIAQVLVQAGYEVSLMDVSDTLITQSVDSINKRLQSKVQKGSLSASEAANFMTKLYPTTSVTDFADAQLIIEAVIEDLPSKIDLFKKMEVLCPDATIFASNTSTLSITHMAAHLSKPDRFIGLHFFNPVPVLRLVEIIPGLQTSQKTVDTCKEFIKNLNKFPIMVQDCPGFLVNRIFMTYAGEAMLAAQEGAAKPNEIDQTIIGCGFPIGPLTLNDMVGLDVGVHTFPILYEAYGERFPVPQLFKKLVDAGRLGTKSGKGIYVVGKVDDDFYSIINEIQSETGVKSTEFSAERLILRQVNEAVYCLQEKIATAEEIDLAMVFGTGFPSRDKEIGGPLHWADEKGLDWVVDKLDHFKDTLGHRFWPHPLLKKYVSAGYIGKKSGRGFFEYQ